MLAISVSFRNIMAETYAPLKKLEAFCPLTLPTAKSNMYFIAGAFLYRNGQEWARLLEWTTGMDIYMCPRVLYVWFLRTDWPRIYTCMYHD